MKTFLKHINVLTKHVLRNAAKHGQCVHSSVNTVHSAIRQHNVYLRESPQQFENRIMARMYVRSITRASDLSYIGHCARVVLYWRMENYASYVACGFIAIFN